MKAYCTLFFSLSFFAFTHVSAQNQETRKLPNFKAISVSQAIQVELVAGNEPKAEIFVDNIDLDEVLTEVSSGGTLRIHLDGNNYRNIEVRITLTFQKLEAIEVSSAAKVTSSSIINSEELEIEVSSAGKFRGKISVDQLTVDISSSGDVEVSGIANMQKVEVSSAGSYDGLELETKETDVDVSSAGNARVTATEILEADASSGGVVKYSGDPKKVYVDSNSGGSVRKY